MGGQIKLAHMGVPPRPIMRDRLAALHCATGIFRFVILESLRQLNAGAMFDACNFIAYRLDLHVH